MSDTGAPWNLPYPLPADLVRDGADAIKDLAEAVADGLSAAGNAGIGSNVVQAVKTDTFSTTLATFSDVTGVTLSITPTSAASKVLVICTGHVGTGSGTNSRLRLVRNSTNIGIATGGTVQDTQHHFINGVTDSGVPFNITFLDSPGVATATTYKLTVASGSGGSTVYVGRSGGVDRRSITTITAIEVAV